MKEKITNDEFKKVFKNEIELYNCMVVFDINSIISFVEQHSSLIVVIIGLIEAVITFRTYQSANETIKRARKRIVSIFLSSKKFVKKLKIDEFLKENVIIENSQLSLSALIAITFLFFSYFLNFNILLVWLTFFVTNAFMVFVSFIFVVAMNFLEINSLKWSRKFLSLYKFYRLITITYTIVGIITSILLFQNVFQNNVSLLLASFLYFLLPLVLDYFIIVKEDNLLYRYMNEQIDKNFSKLPITTISLDSGENVRGKVRRIPKDFIIIMKTTGKKHKKILYQTILWEHIISIIN